MQVWLQLEFCCLAIVTEIYLFLWYNLSISLTTFLNVQGTLRDLSKGGRNVSMDHVEPVSTTRKNPNVSRICIFFKFWKHIPFLCFMIFFFLVYTSSVLGLHPIAFSFNEFFIYDFPLVLLIFFPLGMGGCTTLGLCIVII